MIAIGVVFINLPMYIADQAVAQRYLAARSDAAARSALWMNAVLAIPAAGAFFLLGSLLFGVEAARPEALDLATADQIVPAFVAATAPPCPVGVQQRHKRQGLYPTLQQHQRIPPQPPHPPAAT